MRPLRPLAAAVAAALLATACGAGPGEDQRAAPSPAPTASPPAEEPADEAEEPADEAVEPVPAADLRIVSTVAPIADVVAQVLGDRGEVVTLVPEGVDSHSYEPRPGDVVPLTEADAFIGNGLDLNPAAVALAEANLPEGAPLVLLGDEALDPAQLSDEHWHDGDGEPHTHDDGEPHTHDDGEPHTHDDGEPHTHDDGEPHTHDDGEPHTHAGQGVNPHVWTSVPNVLAYVEVVEATLAELDPEGAEVYSENAAAYRDSLTALDEAIRVAVDTLPEDRRTLVVYHDAWAYFGREYGVDVVAAVQPSDYAEPSASDVRAIIDQIRAEDVPAVFGAEEFPTSVTATIAQETGARYVGELADDTLPGAPGDPEHSYVGMMATNVTSLVEALGGDASALADLT